MSGGSYTVCIVGAGARTPLGLNAAASAAAVRGAISMIAEHSFMIEKAGEPMRLAVDSLLTMQVTGVDRYYELSRGPIEEALSPLVNSGETRARPTVVIGLPEARPGVPADLSREIAKRVQATRAASPPLGRVATISSGHSAGLMALEEGCRQIQQGESDFCLAGGVDSYINADSLEWLDREEQLMSAENRSGFPPGEAAAFCLLASAGTAHRLRLKVLAQVMATATAQEDNRIKTDTVCTGKGLSEAILKVAAALSLPEEKIDFTYCDLNGERYRSEEFAFAALRVQTPFADVADNLTPADCWGDVGAASGPLFANLAIQSGERGYAKGPRCLLWTSSEGGERSAALIYLPGVSRRG